MSTAPLHKAFSRIPTLVTRLLPQPDQLCSAKQSEKQLQVTKSLTQLLPQIPQSSQITLNLCLAAAVTGEMAQELR